MSKKLLCMCLAVVLLFVVVLSGCTGKQENTNESTSKQVQSSTKASESVQQTTKDDTADKAKLTVWTGPYWKGVYAQNEPNADYTDFWVFAAKEYQKTYPNIAINVENIPNAERDSKLSVAIASSSAPDVLFASSFNMLQWVHNGALADLSDIFTAEDEKDIPASIIQACKIKDTLFAYPFYADANFLGVNTDLFKQAGKEEYLPKGEIGQWTPEEFLEAMRAVKGKDFYPLNLWAGSANGDTWNVLYLMMYGADFINGDGKTTGINSPEGIKAMTFLKQLYDEQLLSPGAETMTTTEAYNLFVNKKAAVNFMGITHYTKIMTAISKGEITEPFNVKFAYLPGEQPQMFTYAVSSAVFDNGDAIRLKHAKNYVKMYSSMPYAKASMINLPIRQSVLKESTDPLHTMMYETMKYSVDFCRNVPRYNQIRNELYPQLQAAFTGQKTPEKALNDFSEKVKEILKQGWEESALK